MVVVVVVKVVTVIAEGVIVLVCGTSMQLQIAEATDCAVDSKVLRAHDLALPAQPVAVLSVVDEDPVVVVGETDLVLDDVVDLFVEEALLEEALLLPVVFDVVGALLRFCCALATETVMVSVPVTVTVEALRVMDFAG